MSFEGSGISRPNPSGGCSSYRREMVLVGLQKRLQEANLSEEERRQLQREIARLEEEMGL
ncbi:MAG: D52 family tumor protein [Desulfobacterales bacterium]|nr:D52 family tumor protein [Desulfobacterales bacterium]